MACPGSYNPSVTTLIDARTPWLTDMLTDRRTDKWMGRTDRQTDWQTYPGAHGLPRKLQSISNHSIWCPCYIASETCGQTDTQTDGRTDERTIRLMDRHTDRRPNRQPYPGAHGFPKKLQSISSHSNWWPYSIASQTCGRADRQTDGWTNRQMDGQTDRLTQAHMACPENYNPWVTTLTDAHTPLHPCRTNQPRGRDNSQMLSMLHLHFHRNYLSFVGCSNQNRSRAVKNSNSPVVKGK